MASLRNLGGQPHGRAVQGRSDTAESRGFNHLFKQLGLRQGENMALPQPATGEGFSRKFDPVSEFDKQPSGDTRLLLVNCK